MDNMNEKIQILKYMGCNGILITDGEGIVIEIDEEYFFSVWGLEKSQIINRSAYELDAKGIIKPVLATQVITTKAPVTTLSAVRGNYDVVGEAFPIFDESGNIKEIISYTRDVTSEQNIHRKYEDLLTQLNDKEQEIKENKEEQLLLQEGLNTQNSKFKLELEKIKKLAAYDITMLLTGGTGSGKTTLAKRIHTLSGLPGQFINLNCGAIPENLFESELYGYEKGAFTGAEKSGRKGLAEAAENGTLLLDEISELPMSQQVKLLDFLEERKIRRVGGNQAIDVNCRVIAATNKNLEQLVKEGKFRADLFFRLSVASFEIPDLDKRTEDIVPLAQNILKGLNKKYSRHFVLSDEVLTIFMRYGWPGNIRELENVIHSMALTADSDVLKKHMLPFFLIDRAKPSGSAKQQALAMEPDMQEDYNSLMETYEREIFNRYYRKYGSSVKVAKALNIGQTTAARKIRKYVSKG